MSSLLENYKTTNDLDYESDLNATRELYKNSKSYQEQYSFEDFVKYATENSANKLDGSMSSYEVSYKAPKRKFGDLLGSSMTRQAESTSAIVDTVKNLTKEEIQELMPLKNTRRTFTGLFDKLTTGTVSLIGDALDPVNPYENVGGNTFRIKTKEDILAEENERERKTQETVRHR